MYSFNSTKVNNCVNMMQSHLNLQFMVHVIMHIYLYVYTLQRIMSPFDSEVLERVLYRLVNLYNYFYELKSTKL